MVFGSCDSLRVYEAVGKANAILGTLVTLLNPPTFASVCGTGKAAAAGKANASAILRQGAAQGDPLHAATLKALGETPPPVIRNVVRDERDHDHGVGPEGRSARCRSRLPASAGSS